MPYNEPTSYDKHFGVIISPPSVSDSDLLGNITTDSDQPNQGPNVSLLNGAWIKARSSNTGVVFFGTDSSVDSSGYELSAGNVILVQVQNMNELWFRADTVGDKFCWLKA